MAYIDIDTNFDIRTLYVLMNGTRDDVDALIERNVRHCRNAHTIEYSENLSELQNIVDTYHLQLKNKIKASKQRLQTTQNDEKVDIKAAASIFIDTLNAVKIELSSLTMESVMSREISDLAKNVFDYKLRESLIHLSMFIGQYMTSLEKEGDNYLKKYIYTLIQHGYLFDYKEKRLSLLVFLSFYEAYVNRVLGLALIQTVKENKSDIQALISTENTEARAVIKYAENVTVPNAKNCYFTEFQKWFKGDISEVIKRFMIFTIDEEHRIPYQNTTLMDKKKRRSGICSDVSLPPISIPSPSTIDEFFLISDSHYMLM